MPSPERILERSFVRAVETAGHYTRKWVSPGRRGVPDRIVVARGRVHFVELKAPGIKPEAHQQREHDRLASHGGTVWVIDGADGVAHFVEHLG